MREAGSNDGNGAQCPPAPTGTGSLATLKSF
jgi:hypothetical protein